MAPVFGYVAAHEQFPAPLLIETTVLAQAFASLAALAPGRVFLGLGTDEAVNEIPSGGGRGPYAARCHERPLSRGWRPVHRLAILDARRSSNGSHGDARHSTIDHLLWLG